MKGSKPKMVVIALIGAVAFVIARRATRGGLETVEADDDDDRGIDTVSTREEASGLEADAGDDADDEAADADVGIDGDADEEGAEEADDGGSDLEVRAVEKALDSFDYLAIGAAGAKAAYQEYRERAS
jgi:biotin carboxylase